MFHGKQHITRRNIPHFIFMRITAVICTIDLIFLGICGGVYAFTGFNLLQFLCFYNATIMRAVLGVCFVAALFCIYALIAFRPYRGLK